MFVVLGVALAAAALAVSVVAMRDAASTRPERGRGESLLGPRAWWVVGIFAAVLVLAAVVQSGDNEVLAGIGSLVGALAILAMVTTVMRRS